MRDVPIASDKSFEVFQKRLRSRELTTPHLNDQNRRLFGLTGQIVFTAYPSDKPNILDSFQGERTKFWPISEKGSR